MTGEYSKLQTHQNISLSRNMVFETVEIFLAVFMKKFAIKISTAPESLFWLR